MMDGQNEESAVTWARIGRASEGVFVPRDNEACRPMEMVIYTEVHEEEPVSKMVNSTEFQQLLERGVMRFNKTVYKSEQLPV